MTCTDRERQKKLSTSAATRLKASGTSVQKVYRLLRVDFPGGSRKKRT